MPDQTYLTPPQLTDLAAFLRGASHELSFAVAAIVPLAQHVDLAFTRRALLTTHGLTTCLKCGTWCEHTGLCPACGGLPSPGGASS